MYETRERSRRQEGDADRAADRVGSRAGLPRPRAASAREPDRPALGGDLDPKNLDVGALAGLGAAVDLTAGLSFEVDARYDVGLRSIDPDEDPGQTGTAR